MIGCCSHRRRITVHTRAILDFNFSAAPLGSEPCTVTLMFENTGTVATDWWVMHTWHWLVTYVHVTLVDELCTHDTDWWLMYTWHWLMSYAHMTLTGDLCTRDIGWWVTHTWYWWVSYYASHLLMSNAHTILTSELLCITLTGELCTHDTDWSSTHTWHQLHWWENNQDSWNESWMCFMNSFFDSRWVNDLGLDVISCLSLSCLCACLPVWLPVSVCLLVSLYPVSGFVRTESGFRLSFRAFLFPCDLHLELEYWAETGEFDEDELHEVRSACCSPHSSVSL